MNEGNDLPMASNESDATAPVSGQKKRALAIRVAKWLIALVVVIGLAFAARSAVNQWQAEGQRMAVELTEIDKRLEVAASTAERKELEQAKRALEKSAPV